MARIDYYGIEEAIKTLLEAYTGLQESDGVKVFIEEDFTQIMGNMDNAKVIIIYLDDRLPSPHQTLNAGQKTRFTVGLTINVYVTGIGEFKAVAEARDDIVGLVETALMATRQLGNGVEFSYLGGGEFQSAKQQSSGTYLAMAECKVLADAVSSTT